jgi:hypothetical protein
MTETLGDRLRRSADAAPDPRIDVSWLVDEAGRRRRQERVTVGAAAAVVVALVAGGSLALRAGLDDRPGPVPTVPSPTPTSIEPQSNATRPLVYAAGRTVHVGDDSFEADGGVTFLDATDDGVVFMTGCSWPRPACTEDSDSEWNSDTLWFSDGSTTEAIGRAPTEHIGYFEVYTANPGSLVVWADATSRTRGWIDRFVVYDTSQHEVVARVPFTGHYSTVLYVDQDALFINPDSGSPGCWVVDVQACSDPHLLRYDLAAGTTERITQGAFEKALRRDPRMLVLDEARGDTGTVFTQHLMARFNQAGRQLSPRDSNGDPTFFTRTTGENVQLSVPAGYTAPGPEMPVVQWLDDDRLALFPNEGSGDFPARIGDLLVCRLPDGVCRVAVHASSTPYLAPS